MQADFVVQPSNLKATAILLTLNGAPGFEGLNESEASDKLVENIKRIYLEAANNPGIERVFNRESAWPCWSGIICYFSPTGQSAGHKTIFNADAGEHKLVVVVLHTALDLNDIKSLTGA